MSPPIAPSTFSLAGTVIAVGGVELSGLADGDVLTIEPNGEAFNITVGADGTVARASTGNSLFKIGLSLLQTSPYNAKLSQIYLSDTGSPTGLVYPFLFKDLNGLDVFTSPAFWVNSVPKVGRGNKINNHEWPCYAAMGKLFLGGNGPTPKAF